MPKVSIIMLSYNYGRYISEAIDSVLSQSCLDYELIIIDDGSTDGSDALIRDYASKDGRIKFLINPKNVGIASSFNSGLDKCTGEYIGYISSDDIWERNRLEAGVSILDSRPEIHYVHSNLSIIDDKGMFTGQTVHDLYRSPTGKYSGNLFDTLIRRNFICFSSLLLRSKAITGIYINPDLKYLNDWLFFIELSKKGKFYYIPDTLAKYRVHPRSTNLDNSGYLNDYIKLVEIMKNKYKDYLDKNERVLASHYFAIGYMICSTGDFKEGRKYLQKSMHVFPPNIKALAAAVVSLFGKEVFNKTAQIYRRHFIHTI
jgi:glycosyltransferase involved in cell wall biosynthesis